MREGVETSHRGVSLGEGILIVETPQCDVSTAIRLWSLRSMREGVETSHRGVSLGEGKA